MGMGPTGSAKRFGVAAYTFESGSGGPVGLEKAKATLAEFDANFPNRLIYNRTEIRPTPAGIAIDVQYLTHDGDPHSLWQKFSEIARRKGL